jgi:hypothetical protein
MLDHHVAGPRPLTYKTSRLKPYLALKYDRAALKAAAYAFMPSVPRKAKESKDSPGAGCSMKNSITFIKCVAVLFCCEGNSYFLIPKCS